MKYERLNGVRLLRSPRPLPGLLTALNSSLPPPEGDGFGGTPLLHLLAGSGFFRPSLVQVRTLLDVAEYHGLAWLQETATWALQLP